VVLITLKAAHLWIIGQMMTIILFRHAYTLLAGLGTTLWQTLCPHWIILRTYRREKLSWKTLAITISVILKL
jgi:hypothetical protein